MNGTRFVIKARNEVNIAVVEPFWLMSHDRKGSFADIRRV
jgi:hypothetical protein